MLLRQVEQHSWGVILGFQEHFRSFSTFDKSAHKEIRYHQQVEMENKYITEMSKEELILLVTVDGIVFVSFVFEYWR
jgi:hypothetical protein